MLDQVQDHKATVEALEEDVREAEKAIVAAKAALLAKARESVDAVIAESGLTREEVLQVTPASVAAGDGRQFPRYALKSDRSKVYARGRMPGWMVEAMLANGMRPSLDHERRSFRDQYMVVVS